MPHQAKATLNTSKPSLQLGLTYIETQMLRLLYHQQPIEEMAAIFHISQDECQYRLHALLEKLNANTPEDALIEARHRAVL